MNRFLGWSITFRLWRAFWGRIPDHPIMAVVKPKRGDSSDFGCSPMLIGTMLIMALPVMWVVGFSLALIAVAIGGTARGAAAAVLTARAVYHERGTRRLDLLGLTPVGVLGIGWALSLREFRLSGLGEFINRYIQNAQRIIGTGAVIMVSMLTLSTIIFQFDGVMGMTGDEVVPALEYALGALQLVLAVVCWLLADNAQSPLTGAIIGIWSGLQARRKHEAAALAAAVYAMLQLILFAIALFIWVLASGHTDGVRIGFAVLFMVCAREVLLRVLWVLLCRHLNATGVELPAVLRM